MSDPTPAPLTDEQIEEFREDLAFIYEGEYDPQPRREAFDTWLAAVIARAKREEQERIEREGDGYHTLAELYEYRMLYNAHAAAGWLAAGIPVVKSWRHSDGQPCFGGGWFVVIAELPAGQVSNHYKAEYWSLFHVPEVETAPEWDGHTPVIAASRLRDALEATDD